MSNQQEGPSLRIEKSCNDCKFCLSESYSVQSDWGYDHYCTHIDAQSNDNYYKDKVDIGYSTRTPDWCPLLKEALDKFLKEQQMADTQPPKDV